MAREPLLNLEPEEQRCLARLLANEIEFLVVGGYAVRYHGYSRTTKDLDVLVGNDYANSVGICAALNELIGLNHPNLVPEQIAGRKRQINLMEWGLNFEVLTAADGLDFPAAYARRGMARVGEMDVPVIAKVDLVTMKRHAGRRQDIQDVNALEMLQVAPPESER